MTETYVFPEVKMERAAEEIRSHFGLYVTRAWDMDPYPAGPACCFDVKMHWWTRKLARIVWDHDRDKLEVWFREDEPPAILKRVAGFLKATLKVSRMTFYPRQ